MRHGEKCDTLDEEKLAGNEKREKERERDIYIEMKAGGSRVRTGVIISQRARRTRGIKRGKAAESQRPVSDVHGRASSRKLILLVAC